MKRQKFCTEYEAYSRENMNDEIISQLDSVCREIYHKVEIRRDGTPKLLDRTVKSCFEKHGWKTKGDEVRFLKGRRNSFDAFKDSVAVESESSNIEMIWKDMAKFIVAKNQNKSSFEVAVIIVQRRCCAKRGTEPYLQRVLDDFQLFKEMINFPIYFVGINSRKN